MPDYQFYRQSTPSRAPWQPTAMGHVPGDQPERPPQQSLPDRAPAAARAAVSCFVLLLSPTPRDLGSNPTNVTSLPDRAPAAARTASTAYQITLASRPDAGLPQPIVQALTPDQARGPVRAAPVAYLPEFYSTPMDLGGVNPPIAASIPDQARGPQRAAWMPFRGETAAYLSNAATWPARDTFTDTAGTELAAHLPDSGGVWTLDSFYNTGDMVITNANRLRSNSANNALYRHSAVPPSADYDVACDVVSLTDVSGTSVAGRVQAGLGTLYVGKYRNAIGFQLFV